MRVITGSAGGRKLKTPENYDIRPTSDTVKESLFNILQFDIEGRKVLDLFAGTGQLGIEALSRGALSAVMCDIDRNAYRAERRNTEKLGFTDKAEIYCCDWHVAVRKLTDRRISFDLIFLDPPYRMSDLRDVLENIFPLLREDGLVIVEHEAGKPFLYGECYEITDERRWGFCGVSFLQKVTGNAIPEKKE